MNIESPSSYNKSQIILSSDRLIFNAKEDVIFLFAKKAVGISSAGTFNVDSDDYTIINSPKIYLGLEAKKEKEPLLLGNTTHKLLKDLMEAMKDFSLELSQPVPTIPNAPLVNVNTAATKLNVLINNLLTELDSIKSKNNFTS